MKEALYYLPLGKENKVQCFLCPHQCIINEGKTGICRTRKNVEGKLFALVYDQFTSVNMDPIEKKPLYHFYPGREILSLGTVGCNFKCQGCQNYEISQAEMGELPTRTVTSHDTIRLAKEYDSIGIAYTYNEPLINFEYLLETAHQTQKYDLKNVLVTNGYINEEPLVNLLPYIDAANVDVKSFRDDFYKDYCRGKLGDVLRTVEIMVRQKKHVEITNLVIPTFNDSDSEVEDLTDWLSSLSDQIPLHFSRYYPCYKMTIKATPLATLERVRRIAQKKLHYVYLGNVWEKPESNTYCPSCKEILIERRGYHTKVVGFEEGSCRNCGEKINIRI
jgi:pyruvate formate lyase activating enzyme